MAGLSYLILEFLEKVSDNGVKFTLKEDNPKLLKVAFMSDKISFSSPHLYEAERARVS